MRVALFVAVLAYGAVLGFAAGIYVGTELHCPTNEKEDSRG